jgi:hypothetical protein
MRDKIASILAMLNYATLKPQLSQEPDQNTESQIITNDNDLLDI